MARTPSPLSPNCLQSSTDLASCCTIFRAIPASSTSFCSMSCLLALLLGRLHSQQLLAQRRLPGGLRPELASSTVEQARLGRKGRDTGERRLPQSLLLIGRLPAAPRAAAAPPGLARRAGRSLGARAKRGMLGPVAAGLGAARRARQLPRSGRRRLLHEGRPREALSSADLVSDSRVRRPQTEEHLRTRTEGSRSGGGEVLAPSATCRRARRGRPPEGGEAPPAPG
ncbi:unnamed protein product [Prorocentrum cordatum]|uniref:Uncharacterized protein n=1 Tax=Prorocentrum cordatum TaxID=2364126 RepID=A0ABN9R3Z0_9DINO|nr:unnamed protein product [Polarella glacialis]